MTKSKKHPYFRENTAFILSILSMKTLNDEFEFNWNKIQTGSKIKSSYLENKK